jgi:hypothetical protein
MNMLAWLAWILFWLSAALIPLNLLLHRQVPPFTRYDKVPDELAWAFAFGIAFTIVRFLLQLLPILLIAFRPAVADVPVLAWLVLSFVAYVAVEAGLALLYYLWLHLAVDVRRTDFIAGMPGPAYFLGLIAESSAIFWLLRSDGHGG